MQKPARAVEQLLQECKEHIDTHPSIAEEAALKALDLSSKSGFEEGRFESLLSMSYIRNRLSQNDRALKTLDECLKIAEQLKDVRKKAQTQNALGLTYTGMKVYSKAIGYFLEALNIAKMHGLTPLECQINNNIASIFLELRDYAKGLTFLMRTYEKALAAHEPEALYLRNISNCHLKLKQYDKAYQYCILARNANWRERDEDVWADIYFIMAVILLKKDRPVRSGKAFRLGLQLSEKYNGFYSESEGYIDLAEALMDDNKYTEALGFLDEALKISETNNLNDLNLKIYRLYARAYRQTGDSEKEIMALRECASFTDSLKERENNLRKAYASIQITRFNFGKGGNDEGQEFVDTMTGFISHGDYLGIITAALEASDNYGALLVINVDNLKLVNDKYGQNAGDKLIIEFTGTLGRIFDDAIKVRKDGDEFIIFIPRAGRSYARQLIGELYAAMVRPRVIGKSLTRLSCSTGIAIASGDGIHAKELEHMAYVALFQAKRSGKRGCLFYDSLPVKAPKEEKTT